MNMTKPQIAAVVALVAAGAAGLFWQHHTNRRLQAEVTSLSQLREEDARLRADNNRLQQRAAESDARRGNVAASRETGPDRPKVGAQAATNRASLATGLAPVESLGNAGRASARGAFATQLWAARTGDVELETAALLLEPEGRAKLEALLATLPDDVRAQFGRPEKLMALALAGSPHPVGGMQVLGETLQGPDDTTLQTEWQHADDAIVHHSTVHMHQTADGWKLVVPEILVDRAAAYLTRRAPAAPPPPAGP